MPVLEFLFWMWMGYEYVCLKVSQNNQGIIIDELREARCAANRRGDVLAREVQEVKKGQTADRENARETAEKCYGLANKTMDMIDDISFRLPR